jgi:hypothetical protein
VGQKIIGEHAVETHKQRRVQHFWSLALTSQLADSSIFEISA